MNHFHLANIFGVLKRAKGNDVTRLKVDPRFSAIVDFTIDKLENESNWFGVRGIANVTHAMGKLAEGNKRYFDAVAKLSARIVR